MENNYSEQNSIDSEELNSVFNLSNHKTIPEEGNFSVVFVYLEDQLRDYFKL